MERRLQINSKRVGTWKRARWYFGPHHLIDWIRNYTIRPFSPALICTSSILCRFNNFFCTSFFFSPSANLSICLISYLTISCFFSFFFPWFFPRLNPVLFTPIPFFSCLKLGTEQLVIEDHCLYLGPQDLQCFFTIAHLCEYSQLAGQFWPLLFVCFFPINSVSLFEIGFSFKSAKRIVFMPPSPSIAHVSSPLSFCLSCSFSKRASFCPLLTSLHVWCFSLSFMSPFSHSTSEEWHENKQWTGWQGIWYHLKSVVHFDCRVRYNKAKGSLGYKTRLIVP